MEINQIYPLNMGNKLGKMGKKPIKTTKQKIIEYRKQVAMLDK